MLVDLPLFLAVVGTSLYLLGFACYIHLVIRRGVSPNASTWLIWAVLGVVNAVTYNSLSGDWVKSVMAYAGALTNGLTFVIAGVSGRFGRLSVVDKVIAAFGLLAIAVWLANKNTPYANGMVMSCFMISTVPTLRSTWREPSRENPLPWLILAVSYLFAVSVVLLRWTQMWDMMFPIVGLFDSLSVALLSLRPSRKLG